MSTVAVIIDHKNKLLEALECDSAWLRVINKKEMIVTIVGGSHNDERMLCGGVTDISAFDPHEYEDFTFGKITRIPKGECFEQMSLFDTKEY